MSDHTKVAIFWDYENCGPPSNSCGLGHDIVNNISRIARLFGSVTTFRAYLDISAQSSKSVGLRSELQSSGLSMIDCPHNDKKDVVDKMILVDMLAFAVDHPSPATIVLIAGDRDYAYAISTLKLRKYQIILVVPSPNTSPSLESQASLVIDWGAAVLRT
ncbi:limkain-b1-type NYN domain-containing protein, partial [Boletus coccyginus]